MRLCKNALNHQRLQLMLNESHWAHINNFIGILCYNEALIICNIFLSWLSEKSIVSRAVKKGFNDESGVVDE